MTNARTSGKTGTKREAGHEAVRYDPHSIEGRKAIDGAVLGALTVEPQRVGEIVARLPGMPSAAASAALRRLADTKRAGWEGHRGQRKYTAKVSGKGGGR